MSDIEKVSADPSRDTQAKPAEGKRQAGASWKANEQHVLPKNRLFIVFCGLMLCTFLAALDQVRLCMSGFFTSLTVSQTIVATALPTIVQRLGGGEDYSWVGR